MAKLAGMVQGVVVQMMTETGFSFGLGNISPISPPPRGGKGWMGSNHPEFHIDRGAIDDPHTSPLPPPMLSCRWGTSELVSFPL